MTYLIFQFSDAHFGPHVWGGGQSLIGEVLDQNILPHKSKDPKRLAGKNLFHRPFKMHFTFEDILSEIMVIKG